MRHSDFSKNNNKPRVVLHAQADPSPLEADAGGF